MIKRLTLIAFFVAVTTVSHAQTLKITDFSSQSEKMYKDGAQYMGKNLTIVIYDSSVSVQLPQEKPFYLRKIGDNRYSGTTEDTQYETWTASLLIDKTVGVVTTVTLTITVSEKGGRYRSDSGTITAKRF